MTVLHDKIDKAATHPLHRLRWPLTSEEHRKIIQELRAFAQWIQFALTIDGSSLLAKTSTEVIDVLANQLQMFQLLTQADTTANLTYNTVVEIQDTVRTSEASREREVILNWISSAKSSQKHHDLRLPRVEGTGEWLLQEPAFQDRRNGQQTVLWYWRRTNPTSSLVIDHLSHTFPNDQTAIAYVYFDYREQEHQSIEGTFASLLKQVTNTLPMVPTVVTALYHKLAKQQQNPDLRDLVQALSSTYQEHNAVYIIFDALDECESTCRKGLLKHLHELKGFAKVFVTSRPYPDDIREAFRCTPQIEIKAHHADLERYVNEKIINSDVSDEIDDAFQKDIVRKIVQGAQEMPRLISVSRKYRPSREKLLDSCHGLVTIDEESQIIRLVHHSVHTFLLGNHEDLERDERILAKLCIDYQMLQPFTSGCCHDEDEVIERLRDCPFIVYAATYWIWQYAKGCQEEYWTAKEAISCNPLHMAAMFGLHDIAAKLLPNYGIDEPTHMGTTALMKAASCGHRSLVSLFMDEKADPTKHNWYGTVLHTAAEAGQVNCIRELLDRGVDVNTEDTHGRTPLICATESGHTPAMRALLRRGADMNQFYRGKGSPLVIAVQQGGSPIVIRTLLRCGADPSIRSVKGSLPLHMGKMRFNDDIEVASMLINYGADVNALDERGLRPIHIAAAADGEKCIQLFLNHDANIDAQSDDQATALFIAAYLHRVNAVRLLLRNGADPNIADKFNITPLECAYRYCYTDILRLFTDSGATKEDCPKAQVSTALVSVGCTIQEDGKDEEVTLRVGNHHKDYDAERFKENDAEHLKKEMRGLPESLRWQKAESCYDRLPYRHC
ncbi:MAG: hypothetical protein Q9221_002175 [Calogaya cf. arnoldii]